MTNNWEVTYTTNNPESTYSVSLKDLSAKKSLKLKGLTIASGDSIVITANDDFDAHWHNSSTAKVTDLVATGGGAYDMPNYDLQDANWNGLAKTAGSHQVKFKLDKTGNKSRIFHLQLKHPALPDPTLTTGGGVCIFNIPPPGMIIRITVNVS